MTLAEAVIVLRERRDWLTLRVQAKQRMAWDTVWDERERDALTLALAELDADRQGQ